MGIHPNRCTAQSYKKTQKHTFVSRAFDASIRHGSPPRERPRSIRPASSLTTTWHIPCHAREFPSPARATPLIRAIDARDAHAHRSHGAYHPSRALSPAHTARPGDRACVSSVPAHVRTACGPHARRPRDAFARDAVDLSRDARARRVPRSRSSARDVPHDACAVFDGDDARESRSDDSFQRLAAEDSGRGGMPILDVQYVYQLILRRRFEHVEE